MTTPPTRPSAPAAALRSRTQTADEELAAREEATVRIGFVIGVAMLSGACLWAFLAEPPGFLLFELVALGGFSIAWSVRESRRV